MTTTHCLRTVMLLSEYLDGELSGPAYVQLQIHLDICPGCGRMYRTLVRTIMLYRTCAGAQPCVRTAGRAWMKGKLPALD